MSWLENELTRVSRCFAGGGHVQPALSAVAQQRAPLVAHPAVRVLAVPDRQDDRVPLVALHPLQVLHEERLGLVLGEESLKARVCCQRTAQSRIDTIGVLDAERDDAE
jgi:hypothetical protein